MPSTKRARLTERQLVLIARALAEPRRYFLVNNAGVYKFAPIEAVTEDEFHRQFDTNVLGVLLATQQAVAARSTQSRACLHVNWVRVTFA
jgi:NAD(P)-dependent dehydrogenase (short-subunit alcohol dehydrogenase family)